MKKREKETGRGGVEAYFVQEAHKHFFRCLKRKVVGESGEPDRELQICGGMTVFVELKRPKGGRLAPRQILAHARLRAYGYGVYTIYSKTEVDRFFEMLQQQVPNRVSFAREAYKKMLAEEKRLGACFAVTDT